MYFFPLTSGNCSCRHGLVLSMNCLSELRSATFSQLISEAGLLRLAIARARRAGVAKEEVTKAAPALSYIPTDPLLKCHLASAVRILGPVDTDTHSGAYCARRYIFAIARASQQH